MKSILLIIVKDVDLDPRSTCSLDSRSILDLDLDLD